MILLKCSDGNSTYQKLAVLWQFLLTLPEFLIVDGIMKVGFPEEKIRVVMSENVKRFFL